MHVLTLEKPVNTGEFFGVLQPGSWLMHDRNAFEIGVMADWGSVTAEYFPDQKEPSGAIMVMRSGAWGDLLLLTPALRAFREKHQGRNVFLCCAKDKFSLFDGSFTVEGLSPYPVSASAAQEHFSTIISLEEAFENRPDIHPTDAFAEMLDVTVTDYRPRYNVTAAEKESAEKYFTSKRPRLAVHPVATGPNRNYPVTKWGEVLLKLQASGWEIVILGLKGRFPQLLPQIYQEHIHNLADKGLTFRESAAALSCCDAFVGVDSAFIHMCHALDIPAVGLYGPFKWESRTSKAPKTFAITGIGDCKGCSWHPRNGMAFPPNKPCTAKQECVVLSSIPVDQIVGRVNKLKP